MYHHSILVTSVLLTFRLVHLGNLPKIQLVWKQNVLVIDDQTSVKPWTETHPFPDKILYGPHRLAYF